MPGQRSAIETPRSRHDELVPVTLIDSTTEARLRAAHFTYPEVGQSAGVLPTGYTTFRRTTTLRTRDFNTASKALLGWQVQLRSGIRVAASSPFVASGSVAMLRLGLGPVRIQAPCRVVYLVDEPDRQGFAYGTLPGHPESGEELFLLEVVGDGQIMFTISAFSRPATLLTKMGGPAGRIVQKGMTSRYLRALDKQ
jgi:uncharacterized protein (UPF0548 family)